MLKVVLSVFEWQLTEWVVILLKTERAGSLDPNITVSVVSAKTKWEYSFTELIRIVLSDRSLGIRSII